MTLLCLKKDAAADTSNLPEDVETADRLKQRLDTSINGWIERRGYLDHGLTIELLAISIGTNRSYLSAYINTTYRENFRNWIASLRLEYARELMTNSPELSISEVASIIGYSQSSFSTIFRKHYGESISQWRSTRF